MTVSDSLVKWRRELASLGKKPDELARAVKILENAIKRWRAGYTTSAKAVDAEGRSIDPTSPQARAWSFQGGLIAATNRLAGQAAIDSIDTTVGLFHPWCGLDIVFKGEHSSADEAIDISQRTIDMIRREIDRAAVRS